MDFMIWGRLTKLRGPFRARGSALTRNVENYASLPPALGAVGAARVSTLLVSALQVSKYFIYLTGDNEIFGGITNLEQCVGN